ncbi:MAG: JAB domain-containing protein [Myxococcaceae bacterium]|nr:JAB domain-containing protein [Myxococcaceae bacterium]MCA3013915.1 JAB domain-containing protein [Myxococcaceae bacterium]
MGADWFDVSEVRELVPGIGVPARRAADDASHRLRVLGPAALSDAELLCVLGATTTEADVRPLLAHGLPHLLDAPELAFEVAPQLSTRLFAALELCRRLPRRREERPHLTGPAAIAAWAREHLVQHRREEAWVLCLNPRNALLRADRVALGGADHCVIDPREVLAPAVACRASGLVLVHSHPSGNPEPSVPDVALTRRLLASARLLNITLLDHLVIAERSHVSMLERGLLDPPRRRGASGLDDAEVD